MTTKYLDSNGLSYFWEKIKERDDADRGSLFFGTVDGTSTATAFTATIDGVTEYHDGLAILLKNGVITSASGFTININGLGAKPSYNNMALATADTTIFNINYTMLFIYDSTRVEGGAWVCYRGYNSNDNTIGYQVRTNSSSLPMKSVTYRYRLLFTSADGLGFVPSTNSTSTNATASRTVCQDKIDPFGRIVYYGTTASVAAGSRPAATSLWQQYTLTLGYSFNRTGAALTLTSWKPVYVKCAPQTDGSAIIDSTTPYVQDLPTTADGKIYIMLGVAYSATAIELFLEHPVYYFIDGAIRLWTNPRETSVTETDPIFTSSAAYGISSSDITAWNGKSDLHNLVDGSGINALVMNTLATANGDEAVAFGFMSQAKGDNSFACGQYAVAQRKLQTVLGEYNELDTTGADGTEKGDYVFIIGNGTGNSSSNRSNALTVDWNGNVEASGTVISGSEQKNLKYIGEYMVLYGNMTASETTGQVSLSASYVNCLPSNKYTVGKTPYADDLFSESDGVITIKKNGRYRVSGQVYLYNGFTVNDQITMSVSYDDAAANLRAARARVPYATAGVTCSADSFLNSGGGHTVGLLARNDTAARGKIGLSALTRLMIQCLGIYEEGENNE